MVKVLIAGSRDFDNYELLKSKTDFLLQNIKDKITIISGTAKGADRLGEEYAREKGYNLERCPALWYNLSEPCKIKYDSFGKSYNVLAGLKRNEYMVKEADYIIEFWDGKSSGTKYTIEYARKLGKKIKVIRY